jgi:hypothetical protein
VTSDWLKAAKNWQDEANHRRIEIFTDSAAIAFFSPITTH